MKHIIFFAFIPVMLLLTGCPGGAEAPVYIDCQVKEDVILPGETLTVVTDKPVFRKGDIVSVACRVGGINYHSSGNSIINVPESSMLYFPSQPAVTVFLKTETIIDANTVVFKLPYNIIGDFSSVTFEYSSSNELCSFRKLQSNYEFKGSSKQVLMITPEIVYGGDWVTFSSEETLFETSAISLDDLKIFYSKVVSIYTASPYNSMSFFKPETIELVDEKSFRVQIVQNPQENINTVISKEETQIMINPRIINYGALKMTGDQSGSTVVFPENPDCLNEYLWFTPLDGETLTVKLGDSTQE